MLSHEAIGAKLQIPAFHAGLTDATLSGSKKKETANHKFDGTANTPPINFTFDIRRRRKNT